MRRLTLGILTLSLSVALWAPTASAAGSYFQGWSVPDDPAGWTANTTEATLTVVNAGGNPGGYVHSVRNAGGVFPIGAMTELPIASGDYAAAGVFEVSFDVRFDAGTFGSAVFRVRYLDSSYNGWYIPFTLDYTPGVWKSYAIKFDPTWTDGQALAAGWIQEAGSASFAATFANVYHPEIRLSGAGEPLEASIDNFRLRTCLDAAPVLNADFNADVVGNPPDLTLPGPPTGDYLALSEASGTVRVAASVGTLINQPILMDQVPGIGSVHVFAYPASIEDCGNLVRVSWRSLARSSDIFFLACVVRDPGALILGSVEYRPGGVLTFNSVGGVGPTLPVPYTPDVDQRFEILVDLAAKTTSLSVDGVALPGFQNVPFAEAAASGFGRLGFEAGGTVAQQFAFDDIAMSACDCACVNDVTPPTLSVNLTPDLLWPPNHKLVEIHADVTASDVCDESPTIALVSVTSDEPDNGLGDGNFPDDIQGAALGTADFDLLLRSERQGGGDGRVYVVCYSATDDAGNVAYACDTVFVPHSQAGQAALLGQDAEQPGLVVFGRSEAPVQAVQSGSVMVGDADFRRVHPQAGPAAIQDVNGDGFEDAIYSFDLATQTSLESGVESGGYFAFWSDGGQTYLANLIPNSLVDVGTGPPTRLVAFVRPNPAVGVAVIRGALPKETRVRLSVFDVQGREVDRLVDGLMPAGEFSVRWQPPQGSSGALYLYRLHTPDGTVQGRFVVLK